MFVTQLTTLSYVLLVSFALGGASVPPGGCSTSYEGYINCWDAYQDQELRGMLGGSDLLTEAEKTVDGYLKHLKILEYNKTGEDQKIIGSRHFFEYKDYLSSLSLFKFFKGLPKGSLLHVHDVALVDLDFVVKNITYMPNLYICRDQQSQPENIKLIFRANQNQLPTCSHSSWELLSVFRNRTGATVTDKLLKDYMSLVTEKPDVKYPDEATAWMYFERGLFMVVGMFRYEEAFKVYNRKLLEDVIADNISYIEMRGFLPRLTDITGKEYPEKYTIQLYKNVSDQVKSENPGFMGMSYIVSGFKFNTNERIKELLNITVALQKEFGTEFVPGFDLVGEEMKGKPIKSFAKDLLEFQNKNNMTYFMHAGETGQQGSKVDENLYDTLFLNNPRIGHGYALVRHPEVQSQIKALGRVLEICPISNMVLLLLKDLKNHPAVQLINDNMTLVISSDDYAVWETTPLSHDMTMTYLTLLGRSGGLGTIKTLIVNSIKHSSLSKDNKEKLFQKWNEDWKKYIDEFSKSREVRRFVAA